MNYVETGKDESGNPVRIHYTDYGKGKPVILIHGWPLSKEMWEYQIPALVNSGHRVIAYDRRGFGKSSHPWDGFDYDTLTDDLKAIIEYLNLTDITLIGFSMGGGEVVRYFNRCGGRGVIRAILISSTTPYLLKTETNLEGVPKEMFNEMLEKIKNDRIGFLDDFSKMFFGLRYLRKQVSSPRLDYYRLLFSLASPRATIECVKAFSTTDFREEMRLIDVPTLIIHGDADQVVPIEPTAMQATKSILINTFLIYQGAAHGLFYTEREKLNSDILYFISEKKTNITIRKRSILNLLYSQTIKL